MTGKHRDFSDGFGMKSWPHWHQGRSALRKLCRIAPCASSTDTATLPLLSWSQSVILSSRWKWNFTNAVCIFPHVHDNVPNLPLPKPSYQRVRSISLRTIPLPVSTVPMAACPFCLSPRAKMSVRESDQTQYVHKTLKLCKVQWSRSTKKHNWGVSRWGGRCVCNAHTGGQITERKSLWTAIQNLFINTGWMTNLWPDIFSLLESIYFII